MQLRQTLAREIDVKAGKPGFLLFDKATRSGTKDGTKSFEVLLGLGFQWVINYLQIKIILGIWTVRASTAPAGIFVARAA